MLENVRRYIYNEVKKQGIVNGLIYILGKGIYRKYIQLYIKIYSFKYKGKRPNEKCFIFLSTPSYSDNALALSDYLIENYNDLKIIWFVEDDFYKYIKKEKLKFILFKNRRFKELSRKCIPYIYEAKYIFFTHESPLSIRWFKGKTSNEQIVINLWHGCGFKDKSDMSSIPFIKKEYFDFALVPGDLFVNPKSYFWGCDASQILPIGYPRYNWMLHKSYTAKKMIEQFGKENKIVIWMPTFRKNVNSLMPENELQYDFDLPLLNSINELHQLDEFCCNHNISLLIKRHPQQQVYSCESNQYYNIYFLNNEDFNKNDVQLYECLQYTDALISDYSSIAFDYLLLDKPLAYCLDDYENYSKSRGFVFDNPLDYMPGSYLYNFKDLQAFLLDIVNGIDNNAQNRNKIRKLAINKSEDYCKILLDFIFDKTKVR